MPDIEDEDKSELEQGSAAGRAQRLRRAQAFGHYLTSVIIDYQYRRREWITSAAMLGRLVGVSTVTANDWIRGRSVPRREQVMHIAAVLDVSQEEALTAAGYPLQLDEDASLYARLHDAIANETALPEMQRQRLLAALREAMSPAFSSGAAATEWNDLALIVLRQKSSPFERVERIAWIIDRWHREQER
jgi:hypothetical protein